LSGELTHGHKRAFLMVRIREHLVKPIPVDSVLDIVT
jgi:hypothetical protein